SSRRRHTRSKRDWSSDVCSSDLSLITEKFARAGGFSITHGAHVGIGTLPIVFFGNEEQKQKYLPKLATGEMIAAYALTEPGAGSDALGAKTTATLNEEGT